MKKRPEITDTTRETFIQVFCDLYKTTPIEKITVKDITTKAGYSRTTFYNYFQDPYALLSYVESQFVSTLFDAIKQNVNNSNPLEHFVFSFVKTVQDNNIYLQIITNDYNRSSFVEYIKRAAMPFLIEVFDIQPDNLTSKYLVEFYISGIISTLGSWMKNNQDISTEEMAAMIKNVLDEGFLNQIKQ